MPNHGHKAEDSGRYPLSFLTVVVVAIAVVVIVAIFARPGGFSVEAQGKGATIKLDFADSRVEVTRLLDDVLKKAESGSDTDRRLVSGVLNAHDFYRVPSREAASKIKEMKETEATHDFVSDIRVMLYNLEGPFARPETFREATDDRVLLAIDDLYQLKPTSPVVTKLWEMSLDMTGIFEPRDIKVSIWEDKSLASGVAATCTGNIWLGRVGLIRMDDAGHWIGPRIEVPRACGASADEPHAKKTRVWLSSTDMNNLFGNETFGSGQERHAILTPLPKNLSPEIPGQ